MGSITNKYIYIEKCNTALEQKVNDFEQASLNHNVEIVGIEQLPNENLKKLVNKIGELIEVSSDDVEWVKRSRPLKAGSKSANILVGFKTTGTASRDRWLAQRRNLKNTTSNMITGVSDKSYIFINEDLTKSARSILWNTKKQLGQVFKYIWVSNGRILIKKADGEKTTCVSFTRTNRTGGGVLVYTRDTWLARVSETPHTTGGPECVSIAFDRGTSFDEPIYLLSLYRPSRINKKNKVTQFLYELRNILESLLKNIKIVLCGDININLLDKSSHVTEYENLLAEFGLIKCIDKTTRQEILNGKIVRSCLDHIYIRAPSAVIQSAVIQPKIADHYYVSAAVHWERALPCTMQRRSMPAAGRKTRLTRVSPAHTVLPSSHYASILVE
ncbi:unnamed protein product [Euphydryas editha]|uniref:FP protein C-terminal domain-containing protein n=1 Tax=Euphydryas editha TaxID=104508 RepID=A0AAU9VEY2_EUPED|nr:unnamed protein product [Euphydryas editha]